MHEQDTEGDTAKGSMDVFILPREKAKSSFAFINSSLTIQVFPFYITH